MSYRELQDVIEMEDARIEAAQCGVMLPTESTDAQGDAPRAVNRSIKAGV